MHIRDLVNEIGYIECCLYPKLGWCAKKIKVTLDNREVNLIIIYRKKKGVWEAFFLVSLFDETVPLAQLLRIWKSRWGIEVIHRFLK